MFDLAIIGGGIHGAACAREASEKGYSVLVLEQYDRPGMGTSSKSSKLIHGGLRYLESGQFKLVRECLQERKHLLQSASHLVKLVPFHIPVYQDTRRPSWLIRIGLIIYSVFSHSRFKSIPRSQWQHLDGLKTKQLKHVFQYYDAQTDDRQLTEYIMQQAIDLGTKLETGAYFESASCTDRNCTLTYSRSGQHHRIECGMIINAAGPWVNRVLDHIQPVQSKLDIDLVLGTHIVVEGQLEQGMYYLESPSDKRAVFVMPWKGRMMIGTTERQLNELQNTISAPDEDIDYLIGIFNHYFTRQIHRQDVVEAFAGVRVLPGSSTSTFRRPRDTIIHHDRSVHPRVFTLYGGKLTAHRITAQRLIKQLGNFKNT